MRSFVVAALLAGCGSSPATTPPDAAADPDAPFPMDAPPLDVEELASGLVDPTSLALDTTHVYLVHFGDSIGRVPKPGGTFEPLIAGQKSPGSLDATSDKLYWVNAGTHANDFLDGSVRYMDKTGGPDTELAASTLPSALAVDIGGQTVFWAEVDGQRVRQIQSDGTNEQTIDSEATHKTSLALTPLRLAWTASGDGSDVVTIDRPNGSLRILSTLEYAPSSAVIAGDDVFWLVRHAQSDRGAVRVSRGGAPPIDLVPDEPAPSGLVRDETWLYWTSAGRVRRIARAGGLAMTLVDNRGAIGGLAIDNTYLYWTETARGAVVRAAK